MRHSILLLTLCAAPVLAGPPAKPVPDRDLGLSRTSVFEVTPPPLFHDEASAPGEKSLPKRINKEYPPVIPHAVADFLPITQSANGCVDCHAVPGPKQKGEATPIPASHYVDLRRVPVVKGEALVGARYVCLSCHVPRTDAPPLVASTFRR